MLGKNIGWFATGLAAIVLSLTGCYSHTLKDAPKPVFKTHATLDNEWNNYISQLAESCAKNKQEPLVEQEAFFHKYLFWMNTLSGKDFDVQNFEIVPDKFFSSFAHSGFVGVFMPAEIYWSGKIKVRNNSINLACISHGYGHFTDACFSTAKYAAHKTDATRMDAVANAFDFYTHLELIKMGNTILGLRVLMPFPEAIAKQRKTIQEVVEKENRYDAANCMIAILMNEYDTIGKTWYFLATNNTKNVYEELNRVIEKNSGFEHTLMTGYARLLDEENHAIKGIDQVNTTSKDTRIPSLQHILSDVVKYLQEIF